MSHERMANMLKNQLQVLYIAMLGVPFALRKQNLKKWQKIEPLLDSSSKSAEFLHITSTHESSKPLWTNLYYCTELC